MGYTVTVTNDLGETVKKADLDFVVLIGARGPKESDLSEDGADEVYELLVFGDQSPLVDVAALGLIEWGKKQITADMGVEKWTQF